MVPFADIANHAADPNADTHAVPAAAETAVAESATEAQQQQGGGGYVELVAVKDIPAGTEVTISYSGLQGYTNQRFMAQYGFVPAQGNPADRLELTVPERYVCCGWRRACLLCSCCYRVSDAFRLGCWMLSAAQGVSVLSLLTC
jgi:hypothetical protein